MFVQTLATPNPNSLKFLLEDNICENGRTYEYKISDNEENSEKISPFAKKVFDIGGLNTVYLAMDFITVVKDDDSDWDLKKPSILEVIMEFVMQKIPLTPKVEGEGDASEGAKSDFSSDDDIDFATLSDVEKEILEIINERIRPAVAMDGGNVQYRGFDAKTGVLTLRMMGACSGCPSASMTLQDGIKRMLQYYVPEVMEVVNYDEVATDPSISSVNSAPSNSVPSSTSNPEDSDSEPASDSNSSNSSSDSGDLASDSGDLASDGEKI